MRRSLQTLPTLLGVSLIIFLIFHVVGGDPAYQMAGKYASDEQVQSLRQELGTDKPLFTQYFIFLSQIVSFNFGNSWQTSQSVLQMIGSAIGPTLSLSLPAFVLGFLLSLFISIKSLDSKRTLSRGLVPVFCLALMSVSFVAYIIFFQYFFAYKMNFFPINGWDPSLIYRWPYLFLPWIIAILVSLGPNILLFSSLLSKEMEQDYVITARAKGLSAERVLWHHILRNSLLPISTAVSLQIPFLITGSLLLEAFFGIPGMGSLLLEAIQSADLPVIQAITVLGTLLYIFVNMITDVLYSVFDPKVIIQ